MLASTIGNEGLSTVISELQYCSGVVITQLDSFRIYFKFGKSSSPPRAVPTLRFEIDIFEACDAAMQGSLGLFERGWAVEI